ncbi:DNA/RNA non-specific endonuclease [Pelagibius sp. Alg239-R121]|uniref:DNA/RNA non-specific endonuclease n=1 Tax=Pelagibius sp. Alg239-R121 TaxID=2993448 RepID=UPI0024A60CA4|nr:DNA/RNA non-specific endonuclease [Pelagibius sp. Alg239-R121]
MTYGYQPGFIGESLHIPMPEIADQMLLEQVLSRTSLRSSLYSDHLNYTLLMNRDTKQLICSAHNIDQISNINQFKDLTKEQKKKYDGSKGWTFDADVGRQFQLGDEYYKNKVHSFGITVENPYDKGHMVMRNNAMWGSSLEEMDEAGKATYVYANAALQHKNLNRSEWQAIEMDIVGDLGLDSNGKLCVFSGPIWGPLDRIVHNVNTGDIGRVPSGFFKVICFHMKEPPDDNPLGVLTFAVFQDRNVIAQQKGGRIVKTDQRYQITIMELEKLTGLKFDDKIRDRNPLIYQKKTADRENITVRQLPENIPIASKEDLILQLTGPRNGVLPLTDRPVAINAAMIRPKQGSNIGEWVTLFNRTEDDFPVDGWSLRDMKGRAITLSGSIAAAGAMRIANKALAPIRLSDDGGNLILRDADGQQIDHVSWTEHAIKKVARGTAYQFEVGQ